MVVLAWWRSYKPDGWSAGLFPLVYFGNNAGRRHAVVAPLFWHFADARSSTTALAPVFYWQRSERGYNFGSLPLFFMGNDRGESYAVQFPLFFHFASERTGSSTTLTPIGYVHSDNDGWSFGVGPVLPLLFVRSGKTRSHFALLPLFWHFTDRTADKSTTVVFPYWHRRWGGETTDGLFPLLYYRRGARPGGNDETSFTLFPLVYYRRDAAVRIWATPLAASARGPEPQRRASSDRTSGTTTRTCRSASSRCCTPTSPATTPASGRASSARTSRSTAPAARRACCSRCTAATATSARPTPGCSPATSACGARTATRSTRWRRSTGDRRSAARRRRS